MFETTKAFLLRYFGTVYLLAGATCAIAGATLLGFALFTDYDLGVSLQSVAQQTALFVCITLIGWGMRSSVTLE